jgi:hypothetical protein
MTSDSGRKTVSYMVRCALPAGDTLVKQDQNGANYTYQGAIGLAPEWKTGSCAKDCLEAMSSCLMAHVNTAGVHIPLWMTSPMSQIGWGKSPWYPNREGTFFGQIMLTNLQNNLDGYYCNGPGFDTNTVPGRLGSHQGAVPYGNAFPTRGGDCQSNCQMHPDGDGAISCPANNVTWTKPITVWRGQTFQAENAEYRAPVGVQSCTPASACGGGKRVSWIRVGTGITLRNVNVALAGTNNLIVYYTNGDLPGAAPRQLTVIVNGGAAQVRNFPPTGANWDTVKNATISLSGFNQGSNNTIYFGGTSSAQAPDLDWFEVINSTSGSAGTTQATSGTFAPNQLYRLQPFNGNPNISVDIMNNSTANGAVVQQWANSTQAAQKFYIRDAGGGNYYIKASAKDTMCFDVPSNNSANGVKMQLYSCNNSNAQKWDIDAVAGTPGLYTIRSIGVDNCLDQSSGSTANGNRMQMWDCNGGNNQKFYINTTN